MAKPYPAASNIPDDIIELFKPCMLRFSAVGGGRCAVCDPAVMRDATRMDIRLTSKKLCNLKESKG